MKTGYATRQNNSKPNYSNAMEKKQSSKNPIGVLPTSTPRKESQTSKKNPDKELYSKSEEEPEVMEHEERFTWHDIGDGFYAVGKDSGPFTMTLGKEACSGRSFKTIKAAKTYKDSKPWELILIAGDIYHKLAQEQLEKLKGAK